MMVMSTESTSKTAATTSSKEEDSKREQNRHQIWLVTASKHSVDEMRDYIGCTSLKFLSIKGLYRALGHSERNEEVPQFTDHCFTGDYPTKLSDIEQIPDRTSQLSLLEE